MVSGIRARGDFRPVWVGLHCPLIETPTKRCLVCHVTGSGPHHHLTQFRGSHAWLREKRFIV